MKKETTRGAYQDILATIGNTPLVALPKYQANEGLSATILAKLESFNPSGSSKDRAVKAMMERAIAEGKIGDNTLIIEPTSGNTGIALAMFCAALGRRLLLTMPENMSIERQELLKAYGARLLLTPADKGMRGAIAKAQELSYIYADTFCPRQFDNPCNVSAHYETTGPEIWNDTKGKVDILVAGVGTGGTISGSGRYLKEQNSAIEVVAVEPLNSPVLSGGSVGLHNIQGIGAGFIPQILDTKIYDEVITVTNEQAWGLTGRLLKEEGLFVGISSGAALQAATVLAKRPKNKGKTIVAIFPDSADRYLSLLKEETKDEEKISE